MGRLLVGLLKDLPVHGAGVIIRGLSLGSF
jgi:hypothetical protein